MFHSQLNTPWKSPVFSRQGATCSSRRPAVLMLKIIAFFRGDLPHRNTCLFVVFVLPWPNFLGVIVYRQLCLWFFVYILMLIGYKSCTHLILILFISVWFAKMFRICVHRDISLFCNVFVSFWNRCNADFIEWVGMLPIFWKSYVELILFLFS